MTTQEMVNWAFAQQVSSELKLTLVALAFIAGPSGGGRTTFENIANKAAVGISTAHIFVEGLARDGFIILEYIPHSPEFSFGLCMDARPS